MLFTISLILIYSFLTFTLMSISQHKIGVFLTFLLCIVFHITYIPYNQVCGDEPFSIFYANLSPQEIIYDLLQGNNPPVYELLLHYWIVIFGSSFWAVRLFSVVIMVLGWLAFYPIAKVTKKPNLLYILPIIFTFSELLFQRNIEARMYPLFFSLVLWSWASFTALYYTKKWSWAVFFGITTSVTIYVHYLGIFHIVSIGIISLLFLSVNWKKKSVIFMLNGIITLPILYYIFQKHVDNQGSHWLEIQTNFKNITYYFFMIFNHILVVLGILLSWIFVFFYKKDIKPSIFRKLILIFFSYTIIGYVFMWIATANGQPLILDRYLGYLSVAATLVIVFSLVEFWNNYKYLSIGIGLLFIITFDFTPSNKRDCEKWSSQIQKGEVIVISPPWFKYVLIYHQFPELLGASGSNIDKELNKKLVYPVYNAGEIPDNIRMEHNTIHYLDASSNSDVFSILDIEMDMNSSKKFSSFFQYYKFQKSN